MVSLVRVFFALLIVAFIGTNVWPIPSIAAMTGGWRASFSTVAANDTRIGLDVDDLAASTSVVFSDAMKQAAPWTSDRPLAIGGDGNVRGLAAGQIAQSVIYANAIYPSGDYLLLYDGTGTLDIDPRSGTMTRVASGRAVVHVVARPGFGIRLRLSATSQRDYVRNIRLIVPGFENAYRGQPFVPAYVARVTPFNVLRFTHWSHADTSMLSATWPQRPDVADFTQAGPRGAAWEYQIALANAAGADPWFVIPAGATNLYVTQVAALVHARLDERLHPIFEYAPGAWRPGSATNRYAAMAGRNFRLSTDAQGAALAWYALRSTQIFGLVDAVYGPDARRVVRMLGGVAALPHSAAEAVDRTLLTSAARAADAFTIDTTGVTPAALAYTRSLLVGSGLVLSASGGQPTGDAAASMRADVIAWHTAGSGLYVADALTSDLAAAGLLGRVPVVQQLQMDAQRIGALDAYMRAYPAPHLAARPLAAQSVLAPLAFPNIYLPPTQSRGVTLGGSVVKPLDAAAGIDINAGGSAVAGTPWVADVDSNGGSVSHGTTAAVDTSKVPNPAPQGVYQTARFGSTFSYVVSGLTPSAQYTLRLHFNEVYHTAPGQRVFNVSINGTSALSNFDIYSVAGGQNIAIAESFNEQSSPSGTLTIAFQKTVDRALVNGIEIAAAGGPTPTPTPTPTAPPSAADVTTYHNDTLHTGWNKSETTLTTANVASSRFKLLRSLNVDGLVLAQPLFVANYPVGGATHNVLVVATEHDSVYAFDADSGAMLWLKNFGTAQSSADVGCTDIVPEYGISSTPVIDRASGTLYVVAATEPSAGNYQTKLHALDLSTGNDKLTPADIAASAVQSNGSTIAFSNANNMQRASLLLANNSLYLGFGSHCDNNNGSVSGWLMRYSTSNLAKLASFNTVEDGVGSGQLQLASIWGAGFGPVADAQGNIYAVTGNGPFDASTNGHNFGMSVLKFAPDLSGGVRDWFAYANLQTDSARDLDFGSGGAMLLPTQPGGVANPLVAMGKSADIYLLNASNLGRFTSNNSGALQVLNSGRPDGKGLWGGPAYYGGPSGPNVYYQVDQGPMKAYHLTTGGGSPKLSVASTGNSLSGYGGSIPVVSSNGLTVGTGIVWAIRRVHYGGTTNATTTLDAYDAANVATHLYSAPAGTWSKPDDNCFIAPLVANGKVYAGAYKTVYVFGLSQ